MAERSSSNNNREKASVDVHLHTKEKKKSQRELAPVSPRSLPVHLRGIPIIADEIAEENERVRQEGKVVKVTRKRSSHFLRREIGNRRSTLFPKSRYTYTAHDVSARVIPPPLLSRAASPLPPPLHASLRYRLHGSWVRWGGTELTRQGQCWSSGYEVNRAIDSPELTFVLVTRQKNRFLATTLSGRKGFKSKREKPRACRRGQFYVVYLTCVLPLLFSSIRLSVLSILICDT